MISLANRKLKESTLASARGTVTKLTGEISASWNRGSLSHCQEKSQFRKRMGKKLRSRNLNYKTSLALSCLSQGRRCSTSNTGHLEGALLRPRALPNKRLQCPYMKSIMFILEGSAGGRLGGGTVDMYSLRAPHCREHVSINR